MSVRDLVLSAAGVSGAEPVYVEDVFSTYLYTGTGTKQTINNGINLGSFPCIDFRFVDGAPTGGAILDETIDTKSGDWIIVFLVRSNTTAATCFVNGTSVTAANSFVGTYNYRHTVFIQQVTTETTTVLTNTASLGHISCYVFRGPTSITVGQSLTATSGDTATTNAISSSGFGIILLSDRDEDSNPTAAGTTTYGVGTATYFQARAWGVNGNGTTIPATAISGLQGASAYNGAFCVLNVTGAGTNAASIGTGEGGLLWCKIRNVSDAHALFDTARGFPNYLVSNATIAQNGYGAADATDMVATASGFSMNNISSASNSWNQSGNTYASWTFRKAKKFFDVVTYTGNGTSKVISHNLGSTPGLIIVKSTSGATNWVVWHRSLSAGYALRLNLTNAASTGGTEFADSSGTYVAPTSTNFTVGPSGQVNGNGSTYVAYLFAHDAGGFGDAGTSSIVKCGGFTTDGAGEASVTLDWEPQWVMFKKVSSTGSWWMMDNMRGYVVSGNDKLLAANSNGAEQDADEGYPTATGFYVKGEAATSDYVYIAIRRGPMKTPIDAASVFKPTTTLGSNPVTVLSGFPIDAMFLGDRVNSNGKPIWHDRLRGSDKYLISYSTSLEDSASAASAIISLDSNRSVTIADGNGSWGGTLTDTYYHHFLRRAPGFFDVVCWTQGGGSNQTINHNLTVIPEFIINKTRSVAESWYSYHVGIPNTMVMINSTSEASGSAPCNTLTSTTFNFNLNSYGYSNGTTWVSYLFATCPGVSKVGSYTGTGTTLQVNCGFTNGARFVLIKRTDASGNWLFWDTARGIVAGNDPYLFMNSNVAEVTNTDYIDPYSAGFEISSTASTDINASGGTYIYLAIA